MSASAIIHFTAALGIHGSSLAFHSAHASSSRLAALVWIGQLLFLEYAVPVYAYNTLDLAWPCRKAGWWFIDEIENNLVDIWKTLLHRLQKSSFRGTPFTKSGHWNAEACHKYISSVANNINNTYIGNMEASQYYCIAKWCILY
jgi:hypothetical protein